MSTFTDEQEKALSLIKRWYNSDSQVFRLTGLAGTGKTYLLSSLEEELDCTILYLAYTGKASNNLAKKGLNSRTIHSVIYQPVKELLDPSDELLYRIIDELHLTCTKELCKYRLLDAFNYSTVDKTALKFIRKDQVEDIPSLLVIDEASMINKVMYNDLISLGVKILLCGDPGQLPPIEYDKSFNVLSSPDFTLTSIQRQKINNPIISVAHSIYNWKVDNLEYNKILSNNDGELALILNKTFEPPNNIQSKLDNLVLQADQVLTYTNKYRNIINNTARKLKFSNGSLVQTKEDIKYPVPGDKMICTRNNWNLTTDGIPLVNGQLGECISFKLSNKRLGNRSYKIGVLEFKPDYTSETVSVKISLNPFEDDDSNILSEDIIEDLGLEHFEYGYAITVHKSQGSEWDTVLAIYDSSTYVDHLKEWLYTAITRARKQVILYLPKVYSIKGIKKVYYKK